MILLAIVFLGYLRLRDFVSRGLRSRHRLIRLPLRFLLEYVLFVYVLVTVTADLAWPHLRRLLNRLFWAIVFPFNLAIELMLLALDELEWSILLGLIATGFISILAAR